MTDDIVTRLREIADSDVYRADVSVSKLYEAANEIERLRTDRKRWMDWGMHIFTCPNKGINPCRDCVSPATADAMSRVDNGGKW